MPRQGHKKSRNGCSRCKTRKVKCDEVRPICGGCHAHPELCVYTGEPGPQSTSSGTPSDPPAGVSPPYLVDHSFDLDSDQQRRLELILMSHWCRVTIYTLPGIASVNLLLRECLDEAIELAMTHSFLLNTFLSLSALHLVVEPKHAVGSNHEFDFARVHRIYLNKALAEQRVALMNIDSENAAALYWTTVLLNYVPLRLLPEDYTKSEWSPPTQWITMSAAIAQVYVTVRPMLMGGRTLTYVEMSALPIFLDPAQMFDFSYGSPFRELLTFDDPTEILDAATSATYDRVLAYIAKTHERLVVGREAPHIMIRRLIAAGPMFPQEFVTFLGERRQRAMAIVAHHFALMKVMEQFWWFKDIPEREIHGVRNALQDQWQWAIAWPMQMLTTFADLQYRQNPAGQNSEWILASQDIK